LPRKFRYDSDKRTDRQTDRQTDRHDYRAKCLDNGETLL
jgi:hypothetical protein